MILVAYTVLMVDVCPPGDEGVQCTKMASPCRTHQGGVAILHISRVRFHRREVSGECMNVCKMC